MAKRDINLLDEFVGRRGVVDSRFLISVLSIVSQEIGQRL